MKSSKINLAIFASGKGSNAENLARYFNTADSSIKVGLLITNNPQSGVFEIGRKYDVPVLLIPKNGEMGDETLQNLQANGTTHIILAGYLKKISHKLLQLYPNKTINIHPALLPKYGGRGMFGMNVHQAVYNNAEKETGITIHLVNEEYDEGKILFQAKCLVADGDTPETIAAKVHELEHAHYPKVVEDFVAAN